jgi:hypothetical protein
VKLGASDEYDLHAANATSMLVTNRRTRVPIV